MYLLFRRPLNQFVVAEKTALLENMFRVKQTIDQGLPLELFGGNMGRKHEDRYKHTLHCKRS